MASLTDAEIAFYTQALGNPQGLSLSDLRYAYFLAGIAGKLPVAGESRGLSAISYGDSITANGTYQPHVSDVLGLASYLNRGVSGRPMADGTANGAGTVTTILSNSDHASYPIITIAAGTNDFRLDVPLGALGVWADVSFDRTTFLGAYRTSLDYILSQNPNARVVLCTPLKRNNAGYTDESTNAAGNKLSAYAQAVRDVAAMYGLPVCDWYSGSGFNERTLSAFTIDGLHPNAAGAARLGRFMGAYVKSVLGVPPVLAPGAVLAYDTFSRADTAGPLGTAESGQVWTTYTSTGMVWGITSGDALQKAAGSGFVAVDVGRSDVTVQATLGVAPTAGTSGIAAWVTNDANGLYLLAASTGYTLARRAGGTNTNIASLATPPVAGDILKLITKGTVVNAYVNGVLVGTHPNLTSPSRTSNAGFWGAGVGSGSYRDISILA